MLNSVGNNNVAPSTAPQNRSNASQASPEVAAAAERVIDAHARGEVERTQQLLDELAALPANKATELLEELRQREPDYFTYFTSITSVGALHGHSYSQTGLNRLAEGLANMQATGRLSQEEVLEIFAGPQVDHFGQGAMGARMLFGASDSAAMQRFEASVADQALDKLATLNRNSASHGNDTSYAAFAVNVVKGLDVDASGRRTLAAAYADTNLGAGQQARTPQERAKILNILGDRGEFSNTQQVNPDPLAVMIRAVAEQTPDSLKLANGTNLAVEMANWAGENQGQFVKNEWLFGRDMSDPRAEALGSLLTRQGGAILRDLTDGYQRDDQWAADDGKKLGFLLSVTAFNPNNSSAGLVKGELSKYEKQLADTVKQNPQSRAASDALGRLEIISPALLVAQASPYLRNLATNEARVNGIVGFVSAVVALPQVVIPVGGKLAATLIEMYGTADDLSNGQLQAGLSKMLTEAMSGSERERLDALQEIANMVKSQVESNHKDNPLVGGAMGRRIEDTVYDMLVAMSNGKVGDFLKTLDFAK